MKISTLLAAEQLTISCEMFPPKKEAQLPGYEETAARMAALRPSFLSCTYGASGGAAAYTVQIAETIQSFGIPALAHLTCASSTKEQVQDVLRALQAHGILNILALRGDIPKDLPFPLPNQFHHAVDLIAVIKDFDPNFCIGGACYPEGHPEAEGVERDLDYLKQKVDAGLSFLTTQLFFDNNIYYNFMYKVLRRGITVPVIAGIMPITSASQVGKAKDLSGSMIPPKFLRIVERFGDDPKAMKQAGIAYATEQIIDLVANGVQHIHLYSMNKPDVAGAILDNLSDIFIR